jgi:rubrerythrin
MDSMQLNAVVTAISLENRTLGFYRAVTPKVSNSDTRRVLEQLAHEGSEHLQSFCDLYQGDEAELVDILNNDNTDVDPYFCSLIDSVDGNSSDFDALRIALIVEKACIDWHTIFADLIRIPHVRAVFTRILNETVKHYELITEEYARLISMARRSDEDSLGREQLHRTSTVSDLARN